MITFEINYDLSQLIALSDQFAHLVENAPEAALPNTAQAFLEATIAVQQAWQNKMTQLPDVSISTKTIRSITYKKNKDFDYSVYSNSRRLKDINDGTPAVEYDMKKTHPYGKHSRVSKKGIPYLIINFRWRSNATTDKLAHSQFFSNVIPQKVYNTNVKKLDKSIVTSIHGHTEPNAKGEMIPRWEYEWIKSSRLSDVDAWDDRSKGLVRMKEDFGSTYFTFRVISAKSPAGSWIYRRKAKPATNFMNSVMEEAKLIVDEKVKNGMEADNQMYQSQ